MEHTYQYWVLRVLMTVWYGGTYQCWVPRVSTTLGPDQIQRFQGNSVVIAFVTAPAPSLSANYNNSNHGNRYTNTETRIHRCDTKISLGISRIWHFILTTTDGSAPSRPLCNGLIEQRYRIPLASCGRILCKNCLKSHIQQLSLEFTHTAVKIQS